MSVPVTSWYLARVLTERPNLGNLLDLCEENFRALLNLAPALRVLNGGRNSRLGDGVDLYLEILEQAPYSSLVRLTHYFREQGDPLSVPGALLRIYYDARQVEVVSLGVWSTHADWSGPPRLENKWRLNLFLSKWLAYLLAQGHRFCPDEASDPQPASIRMGLS